MKKCTLILVICFLYLPSIAGDSLLIVFSDFQVHELKDESLEQQIPSRLKDILGDFDFTIVEGNLTRIFKYYSELERELRTQKVTPPDSAILIANIQIQGDIYPDVIIARVINQKGETREFFLKCNTRKYVRQKKLKGLAKRIEQWLRNTWDPTGAIRIQGLKGRFAILDGADTVTESTIPIRESNRINYQLLDRGKLVRGSKKELRIDSRILNRIRVRTLFSDQPFIRHERLQLSTAFALSYDGGRQAELQIVNLRYLVAGGLSVGLAGQRSVTPYSYLFTPLGETRLIEGEEEIYSLGFYGEYQYYFPKLETSCFLAGNLLFADQPSGNAYLGIRHENFPYLNLLLGYSVINFQYDKAQFYAFGDAAYEQQEARHQGILLGLSLNLPF